MVGWCDGSSHEGDLSGFPIDLHISATELTVENGYGLLADIQVEFFIDGIPVCEKDGRCFLEMDSE